MPGSWQDDIRLTTDRSRPISHKNDAAAQTHRLPHIVRDKDDGAARSFPDALKGTSAQVRDCVAATRPQMISCL
jgi:hypothetical protein